MGIVLASRSPRRRQLLEQMGLRDFRIVCSDADETASPGLTPPALVEALSARKAAAVQHAAAAGDLIIAADTVVALDGRILGKPADGPDAFAMLSALSGRRHQVYTGLTVVCGAQRLTEHEVTAVTFRSLSSAEICAYIATGEPMDKAGAYGIQGRGALFVEGIEGDYYNVMGLPVCRLGRILARLGVDCARLWSEL
ncbi:Maf family protein [Lawsonibacter sp.]|uniref:Maf family protein n=1 Tax=Lawsonibacter sp. TaxID=2185275 RepID=UPI00258AEA26|nr:Maf family protein [Lawsonibacter sp.]MCI6399683.1 Maf family protein [Lawsonibacter sp.]MDY2976108.1 Maf family protein [Oscillospiraceae bacterium]